MQHWLHEAVGQSTKLLSRLAGPRNQFQSWKIPSSLTASYCKSSMWARVPSVLLRVVRTLLVNILPHLLCGGGHPTFSPAVHGRQWPCTI